LIAASKAAGLTAEVLLDFPHRGGAKKWVFSGKVPKARSQLLLANIAGAEAVGATSQTTPGSVAIPSLQPAWCALCWPVVAARCTLLQDMQTRHTTATSLPSPLLAAGIQARAEHQHLELALRLTRSGRRLVSASADGEICKRIQGELTPLQCQLAVALAKTLEGPKRHRSLATAEGCEGAAKQVAAEEDDVDSGLSPAVATRTELRALIEARLPDVIAVLHCPPDRKWTLPPPPLTGAAASSEGD